ncbi:toprim domain-containing protein [Treponema sp. UBA6852]|uniref:toprim domain-containing protein n=1 Tax=Treponema sp. UBA6852 TaxID=1947744 RepID=UPI0025FF7A1A|nr:toprim domain-containing protein [Treponema sp. UBA6852]
MGGKTEKKTSAVKKSSAKISKASKPEPKQKATKTVAKSESKTAKTAAVKKSAAKEKVPAKKIPALKKSEIKKETNVVSKTPDVSVVKASAKPVALKSKDYGDDKIIHLDALEHIRLRSGMYIGRLGDGSNQNDGIYILLKEVVDNAIDEFIMGFGKKIEIEVKENRVKVRDYGRGIPLGKVVECVSEINTGAKYNDDVFQFSVGMNGVGTKAVNALSSYFRVVSVRAGQCAEAIFAQGKLVSQRSGNLKQKQPDGTYFEFVPDEAIFGKYNFNMEFVEKRIWNYAYLNAGLTLKLNGQEYKSDNGLFDLLNKEIEGTSLYAIGSYQGERLKFAFTHTNSYGENYFSFVNGQYTADGGTHLAAFKEGFVKGINDFYGTSYKSEDIREGMAAAVLVKVKDPVFESQTKNKLGNTDIRQWIVSETQSGLDDWLHHNPEAAKKIQEKIQANEKLRTELSAVKKEAKEAARKISIRIPKLKDCRFHIQDGAKGENSMIFITEGDSASGTMTHSRNADYQAIFSLRGKPENMYGKKQSEIYKNDELYQLMMALGIEQDVENLKYSKIVIATDADNDGFHIRNLVMTFFLGYFEELVTSGRIFILETPLFRVRNKKENIYCYSEEERDKAQKKLGASAETTRFKGLGEISPSEFKDFISPETIHLTPVEISQLKMVPKLLSFYMGKNTPERRAFIEKHLLSNADIDA